MTVTTEEISALVGMHLGAGVVKSDDRIVEDLGAESADVLNLVIVLENKYGIHIAEENVPLLKTVADIQRLVAESTETSEE